MIESRDYHTHCHIIAHKDAYEKAKILHRDVSIGNILIVEPDRESATSVPLSNEGYLGDWELSRSLDERSQRQQHRTVSIPQLSRAPELT